MKIDRLIGILSVLLQQEQVTAPELAERFEVSRRTINRDIEDLCMAGIPLVTTQGVGGGIKIMDSYRPSKTLLTSRDMQGILTGLRSLDSISGTKYYSQLMDRLKLGSSEFVSGRDTMLIDLSMWDKTTISHKIAEINSAIDNHKLLEFHYYSPKEDSIRQIEPYFLVFKWSHWYVYGFCRLRNSFRMFKMNRMFQLQLREEFFEPREVPSPEFVPEKIYENSFPIRVIFCEDVKWRVIEDYGVEQLVMLEDGRYLLEGTYSGADAFLRWILSFGDRAEILEPTDMRESVRHIANNISALYRKE